MCEDNINCICDILMQKPGKQRSIDHCRRYAKYKSGECLSDSYKNCKEKLRWKCICGNEWEAEFDRLLRRDQWCPVCAKKKVKETFLKNYGVDNPSKARKIKEKTKQTCLKRYGVENATQNIEVSLKRKKTCIERFGTEHAIQSTQVRNKIKQTCIKKYGKQSPLSVDSVRSKIKKTSLERYGFECVSKNRIVSLKAARKVNKPSIKIHWFTSEELVCQGSYEAKVVDYLNINQINYKWQPETFVLSTGKTYRPDLYLIDTDTWVEIKGWMRPDAKLKWKEFTTIVANSELWDKIKLEQLKIL